jgi:hypothetical protein
MKPIAVARVAAPLRVRDDAPSCRSSSRVLASVAALALASSALAAPSAAELLGTYRLHGTARVDAGPVLSREVEVHADAKLGAGAGARAVRARLAAEGHACELTARVEEGGALVFEPGQRCAFDVDDPGARGRVEARLRSGRGRLRDDTLALDLTWDLSGALRLRSAERVEVLWKTVELPSTWTPEIPVRGEAQTRAEGHRDASRAAER